MNGFALEFVSLMVSLTLVLGAILVTGNRQHYERVSMLALEEWLRPTTDRTVAEDKA